MTRPLLLALALLAVLIALIVATRGTDASGVVGDTDCTLTVDGADALNAFLRATGEGDGGPCAYNGDTDCDGQYTTADGIRILRHAAGLTNDPVPGCLPVGAVHGTTPTPTATDDPSPPPAPTDSPAPTPTPTATIVPPTYTPTPTATPSATPASGSSSPTANATPRTSGEPACAVFPPDNPWNTDISGYPVHPDSDTYVDTIGRDAHLHPDFGTVWAGKPIGIPYVIVGAGQPKVPITYYYDDSDPGPYPIPPDAPVEGQPVGQPNTANFGGDRHVIVVDESDCTLYETFDSWPVNGGASWDTGSAAKFDLGSNGLRPDFWTSADAAGLPIFAGLVRYSEVVEEGVIDHALRFTVPDTQQAFIHPATHYASDITDPAYPPMGLRLRMKASYDCSWATAEIQVVCTALKKYGMFVADNGAAWYVSGAPDPRWNDDRLGDLKDIPGNAFEAVQTGPLITPAP